MKMKAAKKKSLHNKAKTRNSLYDVVVVKTECKLEEDSHEVYTNGEDPSIQIKEEPHSPEISEELHLNSLSCSDSNPDTVTSWSNAPNQHKLIKDEFEHPDIEFPEGAVKDESEAWIKEEGDDGDVADDIQEGFGEDEQVCTGKNYQ